MVEVMKIMGPPSKGPMHTLLRSVTPTLQQATTDPHLCSRFQYFGHLMRRTGSLEKTLMLG